MAFTPDKTVGSKFIDSVTDSELGIQVGHAGVRCLRWDHPFTFPFFFSEKGVEFIFEAGLPTRKMASGSGSASGVGAVYIIQDIFDREIAKLKLLSGKERPVAIQHEWYRDRVAEGMHCLITGGASDGFASGFGVHFISDGKAWEKKFDELKSKNKS